MSLGYGGIAKKVNEDNTYVLYAVRTMITHLMVLS